MTFMLVTLAVLAGGAPAAPDGTSRFEARCSDNRRQLEEGNASGVTVWARPENQERFPSFVVAPQCPRGAELLPWLFAQNRDEPR